NKKMKKNNKKSKKDKASKEGNFFTKNNKRNAKITAIVVAVVLVLSAAGAGLYIYFATKSKGYGDDGLEFLDDKDYLSDEIYDFQTMGDYGAGSLNDFLYNWANNGGDKMHDKNIINVLLCGVDNGETGAKGVAADGRSDTIMLVSVDKKKKKITLSSFFRDSWTYMRVPKSDGTFEDTYNKINASYIFGGPATLIQTIENDYKIKIDQYIAVDFKSFPKLIDAVGGVKVDVQEYEANFIRRTSRQTNFPYGKGTKLNGKQALIYSRIRKLDADGDVSRTRRQRTVIKALIESAKSATKGQLVNAFKQVKDYMRTGFQQSEVIKLIAQATSHDWMDFPMTEYTFPNEDGVDSKGGYIGSMWAWAVDYPVCAQKLQMAIYDKTNISLDKHRLTIADYIDGNTGSGSDSGNSGSDGSNNNSNGSGYSDNGSESNDDNGSGGTFDYVVTNPSNENDNSDSDSGSDSDSSGSGSSGGSDSSGGDSDSSDSGSSDDGGGGESSGDE
ncbi:MAG: LCP family protein, partial [Ruminococcus sp.]|nr:LCP family protein [Candidatus Copronaster equi]